MKNATKMLMACGLVGCLAVGCADSGKPDADAATGRTSQSNANYLLADKPADAQGIGEARKSVTDEEDVTLVGRIGGSANPFVGGLAAFTIVDPQVKYCAPDEGCPTPWDYCCTQDQVKDNIATVKVVGQDGQPVDQDAKKLLGVKELDTVIVQGQAKRDDNGNLTVLARKVYVE